MVGDYRRKTNEELIEIINAYMEKFPNASRNKIIQYATGNPNRVRELEDPKSTRLNSSHT